MSGKRRLDRIRDEHYLDGLEQRSTDEIRAMRDECEEEESGVSFARRVLQGRLDILRAEALRRRDAGSDTAASILDTLPGILSDDSVTPPTQARVSRFLVPPSVQHHRREVERLASDDLLASLDEHTDAELTELVGQLADKERELSRLRRQLLDRLDRLQDELTRRYKTGVADVTQLLGERD